MSNLWAEFDKLLPKKKEVIGKVLSINTTVGQSRVQTLSGETIAVSGVSVSVGSYCLITNGIITNELPGLTATNVTIY